MVTMLLSRSQRVGEALADPENLSVVRRECLAKLFKMPLAVFIVEFLVVFWRRCLNSELAVQTLPNIIVHVWRNIFEDIQESVLCNNAATLIDYILLLAFSATVIIVSVKDLIVLRR